MLQSNPWMVTSQQAFRAAWFCCSILETRSCCLCFTNCSNGLSRKTVSTHIIGEFKFQHNLLNHHIQPVPRIKVEMSNIVVYNRTFLDDLAYFSTLQVRFFLESTELSCTFVKPGYTSKKWPSALARTDPSVAGVGYLELPEITSQIDMQGGHRRVTSADASILRHYRRVNSDWFRSIGSKPTSGNPQCFQFPVQRRRRKRISLLHKTELVSPLGSSPALFCVIFLFFLM